jgi:hypothetical protein
MSALLTYRKNIRSIEREIDAREIATRVFPQGAAEDGYHMTMADHRWEVVAISGATVQLAGDLGGDPIRFERQVDGLYARKYPTTAQWLVESCDPATQEITLEDVPDTLVVGDYIQFRQGGVCMGQPGAEFVYLDRPTAQDSYGGVWEAVTEREDIPPIDNLVPNAWMEEWEAADPPSYPAGRPTGFFQVPGAVSTLSQSSAAAFRQFGHYSARVQALIELHATYDPGIETDWIDVHPTAERPYFSFQAAFFIVQSVLRMEIDVDLAGDGSEIVRVPDPSLAVVEETSGKSGVRSNVFRKLNVWTFAGIGGINLWDDPAIGAAKRVKLRICRDELGVMDFYLDAMQITNTAAGHETWYDRLASNALWHAANDALERRGEPIARYAVHPLDLYREDPDAFAFDELFEGGRVRVRDVPLGIDVAARVQSLRRDLTDDGMNVTDLELTNRPRMLTRQINPSARPRTPVDVRPSIGDVGTPTPGGALSGLRVSLLINPDSDGQDYELLEWDHNQVVQADVAARFTLTISSTIGGSIEAGRNPKLEEDGSSDVARYGAVRVPVTRGVKGVDTYRVNVYTVELLDGAVSAGTYQTSRQDAYVIP